MSLWDLANADCITVMGSNMAENHPVAFRFVDRGEGARRHGDPCRSALHPHLGAGRHPRADPLGLRHRLPRRHHPLHPGERLWFRDFALAYTNIATIIEDGTATPRTMAACSPASTRTTPATGTTPGSTRAKWCRPRSPSTTCTPPRASRAAMRKMSGSCAALRPDAAASELRLPDHAPPLRALYAGDGGAHDRLPAGDVPRGLRGDHPQFRARAHRRLLLRGRLDASRVRRADHPRRLDHPGPARQYRPARRRHAGAARPLQHPGQHRHPDALQHAADLSAAAQRVRARITRWSSSSRSRRCRPAGGTTCRNT